MAAKGKLAALDIHMRGNRTQQLTAAQAVQYSISNSAGHDPRSKQTVDKDIPYGFLEVVYGSAGADPLPYFT